MADDISWIRQLCNALRGHEDTHVLIVATPLAKDDKDVATPITLVLPAKNVDAVMTAVTETHNQGIGRAYIEGMLACRADKPLANPYYRHSEQGMAYDSGYRDEGLR